MSYFWLRTYEDIQRNPFRRIAIQIINFRGVIINRDLEVDERIWKVDDDIVYNGVRCQWIGGNTYKMGEPK